MNYEPDELVLKKYMVALVIALNILLCKFVDVLMKNDTNKAVLMNVAITMAKIKTA